jgi:malonate transporter
MDQFSVALLPVITIILIGYTLKRARFLPQDAWAGMEKLTYYILFPALLIGTLGNQSLSGVPWPSMLLVITTTLAVVAIPLVLWHRFRPTVSDATFTSIFQGGIRFNTYLSFAIAQAYYGAEGLAFSAVAAGFMIVLINLLCISAFTVWGEASYRGGAALFKRVFANPLILSSAVGWSLSLSGIGLPGVSAEILEIVGRAALPFGLLAVGAALKPEAIHGHLKPLAISSLLQFGLKPLAATLLVSLIGVTGTPAGALIIAFMVPTAPSAYILARQLGGDTEVMSSIITFQTILAFIVMPLIILWVLPA